MQFMMVRLDTFLHSVGGNAIFLYACYRDLCFDALCHDCVFVQVNKLLL